MIFSAGHFVFRYVSGTVSARIISFWSNTTVWLCLSIPTVFTGSPICTAQEWLDDLVLDVNIPSFAQGQATQTPCWRTNTLLTKHPADEQTLCRRTNTLQTKHPADEQTPYRRTNTLQTTKHPVLDKQTPCRQTNTLQTNKHPADDQTPLLITYNKL